MGETRQEVEEVTLVSMVDISSKPEVFREASATGTIRLKAKTMQLIKNGRIAKGDPIHTAKIAGVLAAKNTSALIPLCHPIPLTNVQVDIAFENKNLLRVSTTVKTKAQTGVEMEALTAATTSLLTIWDMVKQYEKNATGQYPSTAIEDIRVTKKTKK
jgi:cyclic pyranopterin phosphate synthase